MDNLHLAPLAVYNATDPSNTAFTVLDYTVARAQLYHILYELYEFGAFGAEAMAAAENGDGSLLLAQADIVSVDALATCDFDMSQPFVPGLLEAGSAVQCGDVLSTTLPTIDEARADYANALRVSSFASSVYPGSAGSCVYVHATACMIYANEFWLQWMVYQGQGSIEWYTEYFRRFQLAHMRYRNFYNQHKLAYAYYR